MRHVGIDRRESYQTLPFVRPGGDILLRNQRLAESRACP